MTSVRIYIGSLALFLSVFVANKSFATDAGSTLLHLPEECRIDLEFLLSSTRPEDRRTEKMAFVDSVNAVSHLKFVSNDKGGLKDNIYKGISAEYLPEFDTVRLFPSTGRIPKGAKFRIFFTHGNGAIYSNANTQMVMMGYYGYDITNDTFYKPSSTIRTIRNDPNFILAGVEAPDLIGHRYGPEASAFRTKEATAAYYIAYAKMMKAETPDLPLIAHTTSSSAAIFFEVFRREPKLFDGYIMMSPTVPVEDWVKEGTRKMYEMEEKGVLTLNRPGLKWIDDILLQIDGWHSDSLGDVPTLIYTGSEDWEMMDKERTHLSGLAARNQNITYFDIPRADHYVFRENKNYSKENIIETLRKSYRFLNTIPSINHP